MRGRETVFVAAILLLNAADAYSVGNFPVPLFAGPLLVIYLSATGSFAVERRLHALLLPLMILVLLAGALTVINWPLSTSMPTLATTSYPVFVASRYAAIVTYALGIIAFYRYTTRWGERAICSLLITVGVGVALYAIYAYAAQLLGLWEIPRTRMGTGGQDFTAEAVEFSYAFHRALGSFREPSHLAEWLIVPIVASLSAKNRKALIARFVMLGAVVLSGSLLGVIALAGAWLATLFLSVSGARSTWRTLARASVPAVIVVYFTDAVFGIGYLGTIRDRLSEAFAFGIESTNRNYIADYVADTPFPPFGYGLGNASLRLTDALGTDLVASHLSLYVHYLYALGILGLALVAWHFSIPLIMAFQAGAKRLPIYAQAFVVAHVACLVLYAGGPEEPSLIHAVVVGGLVAMVTQYSMSRYQSLRHTETAASESRWNLSDRPI